MTRLRSLRSVGAVLGILALTACAQQARLGPVVDAPTGTHLVGKFVWHDLVTHDPAAARTFYAGVLGWTFDEADPGAAYTLARRGGRPVAGIARLGAGRAGRDQWLSVLSVADVDAAVATNEAKGGQTSVEPVDVPGRGRLAVVADPQGAAVVLLRTFGGDPADVEAKDGEWLWTELWAKDAAAAVDFYTGLVGYEHEAMESGGHDYSLLRAAGAPRAGVLTNRYPKVRPNWLPYLQVADATAIVEKARSLGGTVLLPPSPELRGGTVAMLADPTGAVFAVQKWPARQGGTK